ncbi:MAG: DNA-processing protein DprA, partial [Patescibacteria group bacterium]
PALLAEIPDPPLWLYLRGQAKLLNSPSLTVVGTRKPTSYAISALKYLISPRIAKNIVIISGLAYGIDKLAHQLALNSDGRTIAVLAGGLDEIYPSAHTQLANQILAQNGLLMSEYPPLSRPRPYKFPIRNRLLAGMSLATLVVECSVKSGTMITARLANEFNREVLAVPNQILLESVQGANQLIGQGAVPIFRPEALLSLYGLNEANDQVDNQSAAILNCLARGKRSVEQLVDELKFDISSLLVKLTEMELAGLIDQRQPGQYQKKS